MVMEKACSGSKYAWIMLIHYNFARCCLWKRLDQAWNMIMLKKLLYKRCCCCDTDYNIIGQLTSSDHHLLCCIFNESEGKWFGILKACVHYFLNSLYKSGLITWICNNNVYLCKHSWKTKTLFRPGKCFVYIYCLRVSKTSSFRRKNLACVIN